MRTIISIIVSAVIIGGVFGYIAGHRLADEYPYSLKHEKEYLVQKSANSQATQVDNVPNKPVSDLSIQHPSVAIDEETFNFGVFEKEQKGTHAFSIRNEGTAALTLEVLNKSCSCTSVDLSRSRVSPGQDARITMKWEPNNAGGSYRQGVEIGTNDPTRPRFQLFVEGVYSAPVIAQPNPVQINAFSGREASNQTRIFFFEKDVVIREVTSEASEHFSATFVKSELSEDNLKVNLLKSAKAVYDVTVTLKPGMPIGHFKNKIMIRSDSDLEPEFTFPVNGQVLGSLAVVSQDYNEKTGVMNLGMTTRGTPVQKRLMLRFQPPADITPEFRVVSKNPDWLNVTLGNLIAPTGDNSFQPVMIEIPADANLGASDPNDTENPSVIELESNIPEISTIRIPIEYVVREKQESSVRAVTP